MESEVNVLELENGTSYIVVDKAVLNNIDYVYLINEKDGTDFLFQRISYETDPPQLSPIETHEEFNTVLLHFGEKYKDLLED